ncbi:MAG: hypothetical protein IJC53_03535 [Clostridia bacterium]|nr:hypothetical protein [Clostridia bacterium]
MKNEFFSANIDRLYAAAKEKHGERAKEALVNAVRKTAGKFKKLGEKAYVTALLQKLGASAFYEGAEPAPEGLAASMESAFAEGLEKTKKKHRLYALVGGAAAVCLAVVVGFALRRSAPSGATTMEGAKEYTSGDFVLSNVHTVNDFTGFDGEFDHNIKRNNMYQSSSTVAPDGTVWLLSVCDTDLGADTDTLGLYRMTDTGWERVCTFESEFNARPEGTWISKYAAKNFVFCDSNSNPVVFMYDMIKEVFLAYHCDRRTGKITDTAEVPVQIQSFDGTAANIVATVDDGCVYFAACASGGWIDIFAYNFERCEFQTGGEIVGSTNNFVNAIVHRENRTYLLIACGYFYGADDAVYLYRIDDLFEDSQRLSLEKQVYSGTYLSLPQPGDGASMLVDDEGRVFVFFTATDDPYQINGGKYEHVLEILSADGESLCSRRFPVFKNGRDALNGGIFMDPDGTLYFIERYSRTTNKQITIGSISGEGWGKCKEAASFNAIENCMLLQPQFISDPLEKDELFVDLLGTYQSNTLIRYGYMRLQLR